MQKNIAKLVNKKAIFSWCLFDWALSPYAVLITTFVFSTYFTEKVAVNRIVGTRDWGFASGLAGLFVAFLSPCLGAIANRQGRNKPWLLFLVPVIVIASAALWFVKPNLHYATMALFWIVIGTTAVELCSVFYNAMLDKLTSPNFIGRVSGWGWGTGYAGGLAALVLMLYLFILNDGARFGFGSQNRRNHSYLRAHGSSLADHIFFTVIFSDERTAKSNR